MFLRHGFNERQREALLLWKADGEIVSGKYKDKFSVTDRTARRDLVEMANLGILKKKEIKRRLNIFLSVKCP